MTIPRSRVRQKIEGKRARSKTKTKIKDKDKGERTVEKAKTRTKEQEQRQCLTCNYTNTPIKFGLKVMHRR